ncbi:AraC family transcriptional regulator [Metapseudomonas resinovorans]|uniref:Putative AraC family transcriptional regulator n=1 Tax=Metapseudomonas resinovorans NBRC 106553 TaxID=1245471 RepID=S6AK38_METRE|nr:AraC family transcriptional regulator [Pseudomonas resinovorans]BAN48925.1 putative AraC family transcriptional regulator [Pseudomonas resinovorans NBRC 106553]
MNAQAFLATQESAVAARQQQELVHLIERFTREDGLLTSAIPGLSLYRTSQPTEPVHCLYEPAIGLVVQGRKKVLLGEDTYYYGPSEFIVVSVDLPVIGQVIEASPEVPYLGLRLDIDPKEISALLMDLPIPAATPQSCPRCLSVSGVGEPLQDAVLRMLRLLDSPEDIPALAPLVRREILYRLLRGEQCAQLRQIASSGTQGHRIGRAVNWLRQNFHQPLQIERLANEVNMSTSALHHHFKAMTAMSPLQFQKQLRLQEARRLMLVEAMDAASAGGRVGYESPSQFSREYSRLFGAPPLRDIARLRQSA